MSNTERHANGWWPSWSSAARRSVIPVVLGGVLLGAACSSNETDSAANTTEPSTSAATGSTDTPAPGGVCEGVSGKITVYSGRSEALVSDVFEAFTTATGVTVEVRYGDSGELAGQILTEGSATPADAFFSQDAGALGAVEAAGLFDPLPSSVTDRVPAGFRSASGNWTGTSGRVRVIVYNPTKAPNPPSTIDGLLDPAWKGQIGFAPTNASWQSFVTALRVLRGEDGARSWLEAFAANKPVAFEKNGAVRDAVNSGQVSLGLVNHYYLYELIAAEGADAVVAKNQYLAPGDPGGLVNVAGIGVLGASDSQPAAQCLASYLVSDAGQQYFVGKTFEYPLVEGIEQAPGLPSLGELKPPAIDLSNLRTLAETQELLSDVGLLTR